MAVERRGVRRCVDGAEHVRLHEARHPRRAHRLGQERLGDAAAKDVHDVGAAKQVGQASALSGRDPDRDPIRLERRSAFATALDPDHGDIDPARCELERVRDHGLLRAAQAELVGGEYDPHASSISCAAAGTPSGASATPPCAASRSADGPTRS